MMKQQRMRGGGWWFGPPCRAVRSSPEFLFLGETTFVWWGSEGLLSQCVTLLSVHALIMQPGATERERECVRLRRKDREGEMRKEGDG